MPGRAHAQLRAIILDLARDVAALDRHPDPAEHNGDVATGLDGVLDVKEDFATRAYEDILATAIVNKVWGPGMHLRKAGVVEGADA